MMAAATKVMAIAAEMPGSYKSHQTTESKGRRGEPD
jgi:hypothetical protein